MVSVGIVWIQLDLLIQLFTSPPNSLNYRFCIAIAIVMDQQGNACEIFLLCFLWFRRELICHLWHGRWWMCVAFGCLAVGGNKAITSFFVFWSSVPCGVAGGRRRLAPMNKRNLVQKLVLPSTLSQMSQNWADRLPKVKKWTNNWVGAREINLLMNIKRLLELSIGRQVELISPGSNLSRNRK